MKKYIPVFVLLLLLVSACKQTIAPSVPAITATPAPAFSSTFGGSGYDSGRAIINTPGNGYFAAGFTGSFGAGGADFYLVMIDSIGDCVWAKTYGGAGSDVPASAVAVSGGFAISGYTASYGAGGNDGYLIKVDNSGAFQWNKTYGSGLDENIACVRNTADNGFILAGNTNSFGAGNYDFYLIKADASGNCVWSRTYGGAGSDKAYAVRQTVDNGYIITGETTSYGAGSTDFYAIKTDASGNCVWSRTSGGPLQDTCYDLALAADGGYVLAGMTQNYGAGLLDAYFIKLDSAGNTKWTRAYGGSLGDAAFSIINTSDGGYAATGGVSSFGTGSQDVYLMKMDSAGNLTGSRAYGGVGIESGNSLVQSTDGGYAIAGDTNSIGAGSTDMYIVKIDKDGNSVW